MSGIYVVYGNAGGIYDGKGVRGCQQLTQNLPKLTQFYQNLHENIVHFMLKIGIKCTIL